MIPMTIGKLARAADVGVETVRFYERKGLIEKPHRPNGGFRRYPAEAAERIRFIRQAQELGFSLQEIAELLSLRADPKTECADVRDRARVKLSEVNAKIERLQSIRSALEGLIGTCPGRGGTESCTILDGLSGGEPQ